MAENTAWPFWALFTHQALSLADVYEQYRPGKAQEERVFARIIKQIAHQHCSPDLSGSSNASYLGEGFIGDLFFDGSKCLTTGEALLRLPERIFRLPGSQSLTRAHFDNVPFLVQAELKRKRFPSDCRDLPLNTIVAATSSMVPEPNPGTTQGRGSGHARPNTGPKQNTLKQSTAQASPATRGARNSAGPTQVGRQQLPIAISGDDAQGGANTLDVSSDSDHPSPRLNRNLSTTVRLTSAVTNPTVDPILAPLPSVMGIENTVTIAAPPQMGTTIPVTTKILAPAPTTALEREEGDVIASEPESASAQDRKRKWTENASMVSELPIKLGIYRMGRDIQKNMLHLSHAAWVQKNGFQRLVGLPWNTCRYEAEDFVEMISNFDRAQECTWVRGSCLSLHQSRIQEIFSLPEGEFKVESRVKKTYASPNFDSNIQSNNGYGVRGCKNPVIMEQIQFQ